MQRSRQKLAVSQTTSRFPPKHGRIQPMHTDRPARNHLRAGGIFNHSAKATTPNDPRAGGDDGRDGEPFTVREGLPPRGRGRHFVTWGVVR